MPSPTTAWPEVLVDDLARRRCVIVIGAGVSMNSTNAHGSRPRSWKAFLEEGLKLIDGSRSLAKAIRDQIKNGDYLTACEVIREKLGQAKFNEFARREFLTPAFKPAEIHKHIHKLDARIVITPNVDQIYESYIAHVEGTATIKSYDDEDLAEAIRLPGRLIYKVHGSINSPAKMIFTRSDYARLRNSHRASVEILHALVLTHTFFFIGCGLSDPDTTLMLEDYSFRHGVGRPHFFTIPKNEIQRNEVSEVISKTRNLEFLPYDPSGGHSQLTDRLSALVSQVDSRREELARSNNW